MNDVWALAANPFAATRFLRTPRNLGNLQLNRWSYFFVPCSSTTCSRKPAAGHWQQNYLQRPLAATICSEKDHLQRKFVA